MENQNIYIKNVIKHFELIRSFKDILLNIPGGKVTALENITASFKNHQITGVLGENGAGKTTFLKLIATLLLPDKGEILVNNLNTKTHDNFIKSIVGFMSSEERSFYWRLTGNENLTFFAAMHGMSKEKTAQRIKELYTLFNITYANKRFDTYSSGMKKIFLLMRALLHNPQILLLDEPTKGLDYQTSDIILCYLKQIAAEGKTIILATHNIPLANDICDFILILKKGKLVTSGTLNQLQKTTNCNSSLTDIYRNIT